MVVNVSSANGLHECCFPALLHRGAIHRQLTWYSVFCNEVCQCGANIGIIRLRDVKIGVEAALVEIYLAGHIANQRLALEIGCISREFTLKPWSHKHSVSSISAC